MSFLELPLADFLRELGSPNAAPGGGSAAALAGAAAAALCMMAARLTLGKEACRGSWPEAERILDQARVLEARLGGLVDEDAAAYQAVVEARALPRASGEQKAARKAAVQAATLHAAEVPMRTLESLAACAQAAETLVDVGNPSCITDAGSAGALCRAGAAAATWNVLVNLPSLEDSGVRNGLERRARAALAEVEAAADRIGRTLDTHLGKRSST